MRTAPVLLLLSLLLGCRSHPFGDIDRKNAVAQLDEAEREIREGRSGKALERLAAVHGVSGLDPDARARENRLIDEAARVHFEELSGASSEELEEIFELPLPERIRARAGLLAAEQLLAQDRRISAFRMVKKVDQTLPTHPERVLAGEVLARAGLSLIRDDRRYNLVLRYRSRGIQALEYLVVNHPREPSCPEAYFALSECYERVGDVDQAIERSQDLLLYHPQSPYAVAAAVRLPYLRLRRLRRDDLDRSELLRAHAELVRWLERYPDHELADWGRTLVHDCQARLVHSDLLLARYYERTETPEGIRLHAERALRTAEDAGLAAEAEKARAFLERVPARSDSSIPVLPAAQGTR